MYLSYFQFTEWPFSTTPDPRFVYLSPRHEEAFAHLDIRRLHVQVTLNQFNDRIEVLIVHQSDAPSIGLHTLLSSGAVPMHGVDRVQYEQLKGSSVTRLTKFLPGHRVRVEK